MNGWNSCCIRASRCTSNLQELHAIAAEHDRQIEALVKLTEQNERRWQRVMRVLRDALDAGLKDNEEGDKKQ